MSYNRFMPRRSGWSRAGALGLGGGLFLVAVSCAPPAITGGFDSPHPSARLFATRRAAGETDPAKASIALPGLIRNLDSDDPAVRLVSIQALEELTGETLGYRHFDPEWIRAAAVRRWAEAWDRGEIVLRDGTRLGPDTLGTTSAMERTALDR